jgi:hypothetical protein
MANRDSQDLPAASMRATELVVAGILFLLGALVVWESGRLGAQWGDDGPQAGYFPFYIGLFICVSSLIVFGRAAFDARGSRRALVTRGQLKLVLLLLAPSIVYVGLIQVLGMYVASSLFVAFFMLYLGRYSLLKTLPVALGVSLAFFVLFEVWFKVPLPKGPLEAAIGWA